MAKDRARPFSRKHRRYWIPVTGGMLVICAINVAIGVCAYERAPEQVQRMDLTIPPPTQVPRTDGTMSLGELPAEVMRAFTKAHPQHVPQSAKKLADGAGGEVYELTFVEGGASQTMRLRADGTPP